MKKLVSIFVLLVSFAFTSNSYSKTEIHWWYGNSGFLGDVIIEIAKLGGLRLDNAIADVGNAF